jgi:ABC-2 type transport system permease protein
MTSLRIFFVGGLTSYRALFAFLSPWIFVPCFLLAPLFQILLFAYIGRATSVESDAFYVVGNALQYAAIPCLFAMSQTIGGERFQQTLSAVLVTPARRAPLFLGRSLPVILNGTFVAGFSLAAGGALLGVHVPAPALPPLALVVLVSSFSCTGLGFLIAAVGLRVVELAVLSNVVFGVLLVFTGANVPLDRLPGWMSVVSQGLPFTHGIEAARRLVAGAGLTDVAPLVAAEAVVGLVWGVLGYRTLRFMEAQSRRHATLERL